MPFTLLFIILGMTSPACVGMLRLTLIKESSAAGRSFSHDITSTTQQSKERERSPRLVFVN